MGVFDLVEKLKPYFFWKKGNNVIDGHTIPTVCGTQDLGTADAGDGEPRAFRNIYAGGYYTLNCDTGVATPFAGGGGGGKPYSTRVVAASNSTASGAADADYVCTGSNDEVTINAAINSFAGPGEVILLEGTYNIEGTIVPKEGLSIRGMGESTHLVAGSSGSYDLIAAFPSQPGGVCVADIKITTNRGSGISLDGDYNSVLGVTVMGSAQYNTGVYLYGTGSIINGCITDGAWDGIGGNGVMSSCILYNSGASGVWANDGGITYGNCIHGSEEYGVEYFNYWGALVIGNVLKENGTGVYIRTNGYPPESSVVIANIILDGGFDGIRLFMPRAFSVVGNVIRSMGAIFGDGISLERGVYNSVKNNIIENQIDGIGIDMASSHTPESVLHNVAQGNILSGIGSAEADYYIGIRITRSEENLVTGNLIIDDSTLYTGYVWAGVAFLGSTTSFRNIAVGNDMRSLTRSSYKIRDTGSASEFSFPSGAYGDNWG